MDTHLVNLNRKVAQYKEVLQNTENYRAAWNDELKETIINKLQELINVTGLGAKLETKGDMENLQAIVISLGESKSGMYQKLGDDIKRHLIKHNGSLIYQQLFNGKVIVMIQYPYIENYGEPNPPKTIAIYRPEELRDPYFVRHMEEFVQEITKWEDYDDDEPNKKIGFNFNFQNTEEG
ncbi:MAG: hypothetical protein Sapg2KO_11090 [Saprospiraceae bacterium]